MKKMRTSIVALSLVAILVLFSIALTPVSAPKKDGSSLYNISVTGDVEGSGTGKPKGFTFDGPVCVASDGNFVDGEEKTPIPDTFPDSPLTENTCYFATGHVGGHGLEIIVPVNADKPPRDDPLFVLHLQGGERSKIPGGFALKFVLDEAILFLFPGSEDTGAIWDLEVTVVKA